MTRHYTDLGIASDWWNRISYAARPIRSTSQIWVVTRHQYGISALVSQTSFGGETGVTSPNVGCFLRLIVCIWEGNLSVSEDYYEACKRTQFMSEKWQTSAHDGSEIRCRPLLAYLQAICSSDNCWSSILSSGGLKSMHETDSCICWMSFVNCPFLPAASGVIEDFMGLA